MCFEGSAGWLARARLDDVGGRKERWRAARQRPPSVFFNADRDWFVTRLIEVGKHRGGGGERHLVFAGPAAVHHSHAKLFHRKKNSTAVGTDPNGELEVPKDCNRILRGDPWPLW